MFVSLRLPDTLSIGGVDPVRTNVAALNSHHGTQAFRLLVTPVRVVCANTQAAAQADHRSSLVVRHTRNARAAIATAREALGLTFRYLDAFQVEVDRMIERAMTDAQFQALSRDLFPAPERDAAPRTRKTYSEQQATLSWLWHDAPTQHGIRSTRWAGYQAITEYLDHDHYAPVRTSSDKTTARALRAITTEGPTDLKHRAWQHCTA